MTWWRCSACGRFTKPEELQLTELPTLDIGGHVSLNEALECPTCDGRVHYKAVPGWRINPVTGTFRI